MPTNPLDYVLYTENATGRGHPTLADTVNRVARSILSRSGFDPEGDFYGFTGGSDRTYNAGAFSGADNEAKIQAGIDKAVADGIENLYIPKSMTPYDATSVTFDPSVKLITEGANPSQFNVLAYGATGDGVADDTASINGALDAANSLSSGGGVGDAVVYAPPGIYGVTSQIVVPDNVVLRGDNTRSTEIKAIGAFPTSTAVVRLGAAGSVIFGTRLEGVTINCNSISGSIGVYSTDVQDQAGCSNVLVRAYGAKGIFFDGSAGTFGSINRFLLRDIETLSNTGGSGNVGVHLKGPCYWPPTLMGWSAEAPVGTPGDDGFLFENGIYNLFAGYAGYYNNGVRFTSTAMGSVVGFGGNTCTDVIETNALGVFFASIYRAAGTNTINDVAGVEAPLTGEHVGIYVSGNATATHTSIAFARGEIAQWRTPGALASGNNNDYDFNMRSTVGLTANAGGSTITGLVAGVWGQRLRIVQIAGGALTIGHQDTSSAAANRIISPTGANITMATDDVVDLEYHGGSVNRWRVVNLMQ